MSVRVPEEFYDRLFVEPGGCWLWTGAQNRHGYGELRVNGRVTSAHRHAYALVHGPIPPGLCIRHACDTPLCCNPSHLLVGTHADNMKDMQVRGRAARGIGHGRAKLTEGDVIAIRTMPGTQCKIAGLFGVSQRQISLIKARKTWSHVVGPA